MHTTPVDARALSGTRNENSTPSSSVTLGDNAVLHPPSHLRAEVDVHGTLASGAITHVSRRRLLSEGRPGEGERMVAGEVVRLKSLGGAGFHSSFEIPPGMQPARARLARCQAWSQEEADHAWRVEMRVIAQEAFEYIDDSMLEDTAEAEILERVTRVRLEEVPVDQRRRLYEAINAYLSVDAGSVMMNIAAMGYGSLPGFLEALAGGDAPAMEEAQFMAGHKEANEGFRVLDVRDVDGCPADAVTGLAPAADLMDRFMRDLPATMFITHSAASFFPELSLEPARNRHLEPLFMALGLEGGLDSASPWKDEIEQRTFLKEVLDGKGIFHNAFLTTCHSMYTAVGDAGFDIGERWWSALGTQRCVIDLESDARENLIRKQLARNFVDGMEEGMGIVVVHELHGARGFSVNAIADEIHSRVSADNGEYVFSPGHISVPRRVIWADKAFVIMASLHDAQQPL